MNIIIAGIGKLGDALVDYLVQENHNITIIDTNPATVDAVVNKYDVFGIVGNGASLPILQEASVQDAELYIAVTDSDELNLVCCMVAKKAGADHTIARVRNPEYAKQGAFMRSELGLSMLVNPEYDAAHEISRLLQFPAAAKIEKFARGRVDMVEIALTAGNPLCGLSLKQIGSRFAEQILICAVSRKDNVFIPKGDFVLQAEDRISIVASHSNIASLFRTLGISKKKIRSVMIIGGGKIGYYLAKRLQKAGGIKVKIIDNNKDTCYELDRLLPNCDIVCADGTDSDILEEEGINECDAVVALTGIDEENIIISLIAELNNVDKIVIKVNRSSLNRLLHKLQSESFIAPRYITAANVVRYVRAVSHSSGMSKIHALHKLVGDQLEAMEFIASSDFPGCGVKLKNLNIRKNTLVACMLRNDTLIYANGDAEILPDDRVVVITANESVADLRDILE